jgi:hypothetical protein
LSSHSTCVTTFNPATHLQGGGPVVIEEETGKLFVSLKQCS